MRRRVVYTVRDGDTMAQIAQLFQCSVPQLLAWNGLSTRAHIHVGQKLRIHAHLASRLSERGAARQRLRRLRFPA